MDTTSSTQPTSPGEGADVSAILVEGSVVGGRYRMERLIGTGGMAVVVAAYDLETERYVALKCLSRAALEDDELVDRFEREARAFARVRGENVARIFDLGETADGRPYMVLEYLEGHDLARYMARRGPLPIRQVVDWILQACEGLAAAHAVHIVHRDIKPANLFIARQPNGGSIVKILDFGISKLTDEPVTETRRLLGTVSYMSPEQLQSSRAVDSRTDVWSLGVVLHELLTGCAPFPGRTVPKILDRIRANTPTPLRTLRPEAPLELEDAIARCLRKNPDDRFQSASELADALRPLLSIDLPDDVAPALESGGDLQVWPRPPATGNENEWSPRPIPIAPAARARPRRRTLLYVVLVMALAVAATCILVVASVVIGS